MSGLVFRIRQRHALALIQAEPLWQRFSNLHAILRMAWIQACVGFHPKKCSLAGKRCPRVNTGLGKWRRRAARHPLFRGRRQCELRRSLVKPDRLRAGVGQAVATCFGTARKVRAPQGKVPGNAWAARADGKCNRKQTAERHRRMRVARVKRCGKSTPHAGPTPHGTANPTWSKTK